MSEVQTLANLINKYKDNIALTGPKQPFLIEKAIYGIQDDVVIIVCKELNSV